MDALLLNVESKLFHLNNLRQQAADVTLPTVALL